ERSLGVDLFARSPSYDTGEDAIVRVTASDVRKRLHQFYSETRFDIRIDLPSGSYVPEFHRVAAAVPIPLVPAHTPATAAPRAGIRPPIFYAMAGLAIASLLWLWSRESLTSRLSPE